MRHRVAITGLGAATALGCDVQTFWNNLVAGRSGISAIDVFDTRALPIRIGGQVREITRAPSEFRDAATERERKIWLGLHAAAEAVQRAGLAAEGWPDALLITGASLETFHLGDVAPFARSRSVVETLGAIMRQPGHPPLQTPLDRLTQLLGDNYHITGGRYTNCSACAAGAQAIGEAFRQVRDGVAPLALAGAADSMLNPLSFGGFSLLQLLSAENDTPQQACRPFDATRQGTVLGEGAAFLVLETLDRARARRATVFGEVLGYGSSLDAYRVTDPEPFGSGAALSMNRALIDAGLAPRDIDCVNAHGTGTPKNDVAETRAIKQALGRRSMEIPVTANKSMTGHLIAASGALEAIASVLSLSEGLVPPTINLLTPDPECDLDYVPNASRAFHGHTVLSNSFGFGGQNATLIFGKAPGTTL